MRRVITASALVALTSASCGNGTKCAAATCEVGGQQISGTYEIVFTPVVNCPIWAADAQPSSEMQVQVDDEGNVQVVLDVGIASNPQLLTGSQYEGGEISALEQLNPELGIPNSQINGAFSAGPNGLQFNGSLTLTSLGITPASGAGSGGGGGNTSSIGGGGGSTAQNGCSETYTAVASLLPSGE